MAAAFWEPSLLRRAAREPKVKDTNLATAKRTFFALLCTQTATIVRPTKACGEELWVACDMSPSYTSSEAKRVSARLDAAGNRFLAQLRPGDTRRYRYGEYVDPIYRL
jgi:hypothetical protein